MSEDINIKIVHESINISVDGWEYNPDAGGLPVTTAENDVIVGNSTVGTWVKKTLAQFKTILGLGSAAYTDSTAYLPANTTIADEKVKYDAVDPTAGYLSTKIVAGTGITLSEGTGADENKLKIDGATTYTLPIATDLVLGGVKKGSRVSIDAAGVISADVQTTDISGKVDKVAGKGLSTNDLTDILKGNYDTAFSWGNHAGLYSLLGHLHTGTYLPVSGAGDIYTHNASEFSLLGHLHTGTYEVPLTFTSGLTRTANDVKNDLLTGLAGGQTIVFGTGIGDYGIYKSTTGAGTSAGIAHQWTGGTNGATVIATMLNNGNVGIGTTAPATTLEVVGTDNPFLASAYGTNNTGMIGRKALGTQSSPTAVTVNNFLTFFGGRGYQSNSAWSPNTGLIAIKSAQGFTSTANGTYITFETTPLDSITRAEAMRITSTGNVGIGTTSPTSKLHLAAGTATAGTSATKWTPTTSVLLTVPEVGAWEPVTDDISYTISTGTARKQIVMTDGTNLTSGRIPVASTNGRLINSADLSGSGTRALNVTAAGALSPGGSVITGKVVDGSATAIALATVGNWDANGIFIGTTLAGTYEGIYWKDDNYLYFCYTDTGSGTVANEWIRTIRG